MLSDPPTARRRNEVTQHGQGEWGPTDARADKGEYEAPAIFVSQTLDF